ncbi:hypothetical protein FLL45_03460 [Aliikangiella marina]|uniref:Nuclear receptor domain-containing protein n=1 Tax=Aliikangiella marina TaxID=1712262 RepID=A0A545TIH2_9GAMM|nr:hypothetical protein FLL45_03460 [Aliikangiella marina]
MGCFVFHSRSQSLIYSITSEKINSCSVDRQWRFKCRNLRAVACLEPSEIQGK